MLRKFYMLKRRSEIHQPKDKQLTLLLPQNVDRLTLRLELVGLVVVFSKHDSSPVIDWGSPWSIEDSISPIDRWDSLPGIWVSISFSLTFSCRACCSLIWTLDSLIGSECKCGLDFSAELKISLGDPTSKSSPPYAWIHQTNADVRNEFQ